MRTRTRLQWLLIALVVGAGFVVFVRSGGPDVVFQNGSRHTVTLIASNRDYPVNPGKSVTLLASRLQPEFVVLIDSATTRRYRMRRPPREYEHVRLGGLYRSAYGLEFSRDWIWAVPFENIERWPGQRIVGEIPNWGDWPLRPEP